MKTLSQYPGLIGQILRRNERRRQRAWIFRHVLADAVCAVVPWIFATAGIVTLIAVAAWATGHFLR